MQLKTYHLTIGALNIEVIRKNIKNLHLGVYPPNGRIRLAAPLRVDDEAIRLFAISKLGWIKTQQAKFQAQARENEQEFVSGESHYFEGRRYLLNVIYYNAPPKVHIRNKKYIDLYVRDGSNTQKRRQVLYNWYREHLKTQIPPLIKKWQGITGLNINGWHIKLMKTKWGSCNIEAKQIWLNLTLAKKPSYCLEYVILHELIHLLERHHNRRFTSYLDKFMPNWHFYKAELNEYPLNYQE